MLNFIGCFCSAKITDIDIVTDATASSPPESSAVEAPMSSVGQNLPVLLPISSSPAVSMPSVSQVTSSPAEMTVSAPLTVTGGISYIIVHSFCAFAM